METVQELIAQRRGYKYLDKNGESPYQNYHYDLKSRQIMVTELDADPSHDCGSGWNLATLKWIADNCLKLDGIIIECAISKTAQIIVPVNSDGKFRTDKIKITKVHPVESLFPILKDLNKRLADYEPINPITAEKMPPVSKIRKILDQVGDQVWDQVGDQVWNQVKDQVRNQVWNQVRDQIWNQVKDQIRNQVRDQIWNQVKDQIRDQVGDQIWNQVRVCSYKAIADFFNLDYDHPAFDLIRMGIIVVNVLGKFKVFGKNGKFLGEIISKKK